MEFLDCFLAAGALGVGSLDCLSGTGVLVGARGVGVSQARLTAGVLGQESSDALPAGHPGPETSELTEPGRPVDC